MTDIDYSFLMNGETGGTATATKEAPIEREPTESEQTRAALRGAIDSVTDFLTQGTNEEDTSTPPRDESGRFKSTKQPEKKAETVTDEPDETPAPRDLRSSIPVELIEAAREVGISPSDAYNYPSAEKLELAVWRRNHALQQRKTREPEQKEEPDDFPEFQIDESVLDKDSAAKLNNTMKAQAKIIQQRADRKVAAMADELEQVKQQLAQIANETSSSRDTQMARLVDEEVASWGPEFKELLGQPSKVIRNPKSPQYAEVAKLSQFVKRQIKGMQALGEQPSEDDVIEVVRMGRAALYSNMEKQRTRNTVQRELMQHRGATSLRPNSGRFAEPPQQGDAAGKAAISGYLADQGLDPWSRKSVA